MIFGTFIFLALLHVAFSAKDSGQCLSPPSSTDVTGFSVFYTRPNDAGAFIQDLRPIIKASRAESGNRAYHMYVNDRQPGAVGFVERYKDVEALQSHLKSKHTASIFQHEYYKELKARDPDLFGPWKEVSQDVPAGEEIEMVFYWVMNCTKKHVWDIITDWEDASWVKGDPKTTIVPLDADGNVVSDEEAAKIGYVDPQGGLGPVVQRRTWANGLYVDVRMLSKDESTFTTVQQTLSALVFPKVTFDKFFVTLTLDSEGLDPDLSSRLRYHVRATVKKGTNDDARETLKNDFYGPRIEFYQQYFNCSKAISVKRAQKAAVDIYSALAETGDKRLGILGPLFVDDSIAKDYLDGLVGYDHEASARVTNPIPLFATPDLRVPAVEDVVITSMTKAYIKSRIVIYQFDEWGRVVSLRTFDAQEDKDKSAKAKKLKKAMTNYFKVLKSGDIEKVRELYAKVAELHDPASFAPARTFDSVYTNFYKLATNFTYARSPTRTFFDADNGQVAQLIDASFQLASGGDLKATPIQIFTFGKKFKITSFEAFFKPRVIDFSKLK